MPPPNGLGSGSITVVSVFVSQSHEVVQISSLYQLCYFYPSSDSTIEGATPVSLQVAFLLFLTFLSLSLLIERNWTWKLPHVLACSPLFFLICEHFLTQVWQ